MEHPTITIRNVIQNIIGLAFYFWSWFLLLVLPPASLVVVFTLPDTTPEHGSSAVLIAEVVLVVIFIVVGLLLRWLGRGVLTGSRARTLVAALCTLALGSRLLWTKLAFPADALPMGEEALFGVLGILLVVGAIALFWVVTRGSRQHEA